MCMVSCSLATDSNLVHSQKGPLIVFILIWSDFDQELKLFNVNVFFLMRLATATILERLERNVIQT